MSDFETQLDRHIPAARHQAMKSRQPKAETSVIALQRAERKQQREELRNQIAQIMLGDINIGYKKLMQLGATPTTEIKIGTHEVDVPCQLPYLKQLLSRSHTHKKTVNDTERFWVLGGYILGEGSYETPEVYMYHEFQGGGTEHARFGNCILLAHDGQVLNTSGSVSKYTVLPPDNWPIAFTGDRPTPATSEDLVPNVVLDAINNPEALSDLTQIAPVTTFRNTISQLVAAAAL